MHVPLMSILIASLAVFVVSAESCAQRALGPADTRTLESGFSFVRFPIGYVCDNPELFELELDASQYRQFKKFDAKQIPKFDEIKQSTIKKDGLNQGQAQDGEFELTFKNRAEKEAALLAFEFEYYQQFRRQLLKHQQVRLDQVLAWESSGGKHRFDRFASKSVFAQLPIDDEKAEIVTKKVASEKVIYNNGMAAKRNELQAKLLELLEPEQKKRLAFYLDDKDSDFYDAELAGELSKQAVVFDFEPNVGMRHLERLASFRPGDYLKAEKAASDFKDEFGSSFISNRKYLEYPEEDRWDAYYETASKLMKEKYAERLRATLTDRQQKLYEKMCFKKYLKLKGPFEIFRVGPLATRLGLTQKQKSKFASMYDDIADELDKTASKLTLEGYERIVDSYPQRARKKLKKFFGDPPQVALVYDQL